MDNIKLEPVHFVGLLQLQIIKYMFLKCCGQENLLRIFILKHDFNRVFTYRDYIHIYPRTYMHFNEL